MKICIASSEHSSHGGIGIALRRQAQLLSAYHEVTLIERPEPSEALARMSFAGDDHLRSAAVLEAIEAAYADGPGPDVLEVCDYRALGLVPLQARAAGHPLLRDTVVAVQAASSAELLALHDGCSVLPGERRAAELEREQFRLADRLFWPGGDVLDLYRRYYGDALLPLPARVGRPFPTALDPPRARARAGSAPLRILCAGRMQRLKGVFDLVEACLGLPADDWELTLIGADTETAAMGQSARLTIEAMCEGDPRVSLEDALPHDELLRRLPEYDLLVSASTFEVCANVVLEAMRAGLPVLATPVGAQTEVIEHGVSGWLAEDVGVVALRSALAALLADRGEVERVRSSGDVFAAFARFTDPAPLLSAYEALDGERTRSEPRVAPEEPPVTAVLPYFRAHRYIGGAVASILSQTHRNLDVVIVNDGSFGPEDAVLETLGADPRVRVVHQLNRGDLAARNLGLGLARGEYLLMFDADNELEPEFVARALTMFRERPELAYVTSWMRFVDLDGEELDGGGYAPLGNRVIEGEEENWDGDTSALISRRALDLLRPPLAVDGAMQGDWLLYRRLRALGEYGAVIPERLVRYRVRPESNLRAHDERLHARSWGEGQDWRGLAATRWTGNR